nr:hypothetical protein [uncultured Flavobacterium sp.]
MKLFAEKSIENLFKDSVAKIKTTMSSSFRSDLLTKDIDILTNEIYPYVKIQTSFELNKANTEVKVSMKKVSVDKLPYDVRMFATQRSYDLACVTYYIPSKGNKNLLNYQPRQNTNFSYDANVTDTAVHLEFQTRYANEKLNEETEKQVSLAFANIVEKIEENLEQVKSECNQFNETLKERIKQEIENYRRDNNDREERENRLNPFK